MQCFKKVRFSAARVADDVHVRSSRGCSGSMTTSPTGLRPIAKTFRLLRSGAFGAGTDSEPRCRLASLSVSRQSSPMTLHLL